MSASHYAYSTNKKHLGEDQKRIPLWKRDDSLWTCNGSLKTSGFLSVTDKGWFRRSPRRWHISMPAQLDHID